MNDNNLVYSTATGRIKATATPQENNLASDGIVRIKRESKGRKGKGVTTVHGAAATTEELKQLCTELKKICGCGGAVKNGIIEIQGDNRDKIKSVLEKKGLKVKLAGG